MHSSAALRGRGARLARIAGYSRSPLWSGARHRAEHAPPGPLRFLESRHGFAEIVERGFVVFVERPRVNLLHLEREIMNLSKDASRHGHRFAQQ